MSVISVNKLSFAYDGASENVFDDISFSMDTSWKLGLIGRNGRGKTTLLKILLGNLEYNGSIISKNDFYYFPCRISDKNEITIEIIRNQCFKDDWEIIRELNFLKCDSEILYRPFDTLSMGEQTKCLLCAMFLIDNAFLLLDEPTNHLDSQSRQIVADYLKRKNGFILVSHNRYLLNEVCDHIISINRSNIDVIAGNYDVWKDSFDKKEQFEKSKNDKLKKDIKRLDIAAKRTAVWSDKTEKSKIGLGDGHFDKGYVGHKA
ncbi:MAG: ATP-binding cassette domain-containing protein, partial [Eubacterium sp.]|nr:ATP-binding cassette domain-containing protein [Eubacterium sp.]